MKITRKIMALVLSLTMMLSCVGISAYAAPADDLTIANFSLVLTESENSLSVALNCNKSVTAWSGAGGRMSVTDKNSEDASSYFTLTSISNSIGDNNNDTATGEWSSTDETDGGITLASGTWTTYTYTVAESIPEGTYTFKMTFTQGDNFDSEMEDYSIGGQSITATYTVGSTAPEVTAPYTATLSSTTTTVDNSGTDKVSVNVVVGGITGSFASTEIKLTYDPAYLTFDADSSSCALTATVPEGKSDQAVAFSTSDNSDGTKTLLIRDYGGNMTVDANGTTAYTVVFSTVKGGNTNVSLSSAGFSTQDNAASADLSYVTDTSSSVPVTINHKATVTVDGTAGTTAYVAPNSNYTYQISNYNATKYTYAATATENNVAVDASRISISNTGLVTVTGVTGELAVSITATLNSYNIIWKDTESAITTTDKPTTQTYGTGISFAVKAGEQPADSTKDGYYYSVKAYLTSDSTQTINVSGTPTDDNYAAKTYTIAADAITGDITIEVTKEPVSATETTITINGDYTELSKDGSALASKTLKVTMNSDVTLILKKEDGYTYTVQTKVGDAEAQDVNIGEDGSFTISVGKEALTLIITKTLDTTSLNVSQYVQLDGTVMWLVKINGNGTEQISGKTYTYDGNNMFWSSKYEAYCYLIVETTDPYNNADESAKAAFTEKFGMTDTAAVAINYNGNVNLTKDANSAAVIDVNDAQLVWNMYSAVYSDTNTVSVQKFLEADMDFNGELSTNDAAEVVKLIS